MPFIKGQTGNPQGRPTGSQNYVTTDIKEFINNFLNENLNTLQADFDNLESKERLYFMEKLLKYVVPVKADHTVKQPTSKYADWTTEQIKAEIERLDSRYQ